MTYQLIYSSEATVPMLSEDLEALLAQARRNNARQGISGALVYTDRIFLQILEGDRATVQALMDTIRKDVRHERVVVLREAEMPVARFGTWNMAYVGATPAQAARWAGLRGDAETDPTDQDADDRDRTGRFASDILAMLAPTTPDEPPSPSRNAGPEDGPG